MPLTFKDVMWRSSAAENLQNLSEWILDFLNGLSKDTEWELIIEIHFTWFEQIFNRLINKMPCCFSLIHSLSDSSEINVFETDTNWAPSSEFVSSSIPSWQILTAHAQPFRGARDLAFCLKVLLDSLLVWASSGGSGETARMRRLAWTFAARIGYKYQIRLSRSNSCSFQYQKWLRNSKIVWKLKHVVNYQLNYSEGQMVSWSNETFLDIKIQAVLFAIFKINWFHKKSTIMPLVQYSFL